MTSLNRFIAATLILGSLTGCMQFNRVVTSVSDKVITQAVEYCTLPYHQRLANYVFWNGELLGESQSGEDITVTIDCGDEPD